MGRHPCGGLHRLKNMPGRVKILPGFPFSALDTAARGESFGGYSIVSCGEKMPNFAPFISPLHTQSFCRMVALYRDDFSFAFDVAVLSGMEKRKM